MSTHVKAQHNTNLPIHTTVCIDTNGLLQLIMSKIFWISLMMPLGAILLGLLIAALSNWCNTGRMF